MKHVLYTIFRPTITLRAITIDNIRQEKIARLRHAIQYINDNDEVSLIWIFPQVCKILKIYPNDSAYRFVIQITLRSSGIESLAKQLP